jgi:mediator of RNA polymerase II transcription subunit 28
VIKSCLSALTNPTTAHIHDSDEVKTSVEQTIQRFLDIARQIECFFLQKRLLLSVQKPELIIVEDCNELRNEIARKDQILGKYYEKLQLWQSMINETVATGNAPNLQRQTSMTGPQTGPQPQTSLGPMTAQSSQQSLNPQIRLQSPISQTNALMKSSLVPQMPTTGPTHPALNAPQMAPTMMASGGMLPPPPPQSALASGQQTNAGPMMAQMGPQPTQQMQQFLPQQPHAGGLQGPLAYLERTTSNIGLPEPRR